MLFYFLGILFAVSYENKDVYFCIKIDCMKNVAHDTSKDPRLIDIGNRIKNLRIEKGYSSAEIFAYEHELNRVSYWRMERGSNLTLSSLLRILDIHKLSLQEFFGKEQKK